jgi:protein-S-isoprenylcysteine O-methyltransferase Ste14
MRTGLAIRALTKYLAGLVLVALFLFVPAGSLAYPNGCLFISLLFIPMLVLGLVLLFKAPELLEKRLNAKEEQGEQRKVVGLSALLFLAGFVIAALDFRFGWSQLPGWLVLAASAVLLLSYGMYAEVMRENAYLSRTVEIQENQKVIDTGLYGVVRHPMYMVTLFLFLAMPLVLGSVISFVIMLLYIPIIIKRILNEEQVLAEVRHRGAAELARPDNAAQVTFHERHSRALHCNVRSHGFTDFAVNAIQQLFVRFCHLNHLC